MWGGRYAQMAHLNLSVLLLDELRQLLDLLLERLELRLQRDDVGLAHALDLLVGGGLVEAVRVVFCALLEAGELRREAADSM